MITIFCIQPKGFNVGNEVIHMGLRHLLYKAFGEVVNIISLPTVSHYESQSKAGLTAKTIHEINQYGHGVIVGGGNLYENGELTCNINALESLEVPLMLFSLSRGRIYNRRSELVDRTDAMTTELVKALNKRADYSLARDESTLDFLRSLDINKAILGGCPTIFLNQIAHQLPPLPEKEKAGVLISIRNPHLMNIPIPLQEQVRTHVNDIVSYLRKNGHKNIRLLCHDHRDIPFAVSFTDLEYVYTGDAYSYLSLLRSCELNISYRLHATLPCMSFGTPSIKISYDERAASMMNTIGLGEWNINLVDSEDLLGDVINRIEKINKFQEDLTSIKKCWNDTYNNMTHSLERFSKDVKTYAKL